MNGGVRKVRVSGGEKERKLGRMEEDVEGVRRKLKELRKENDGEGKVVHRGGNGRLQ